MRKLKLVILSVALVFSANVYAKDIHTHINDLIAENQKGWKDFKNKDLGKFFKKDGFRDYLDVYPVTSLTGGFQWEPGMGREFIGPLSGLPIKAPFSDYIPLPEGPVLDSGKTYRIGFVYHWGFHPWLISLADTAVYEANLHPNVEIEVLDAEGDDNKMGQMIDDFIAKKMDAIVMWPAREAPMGPPVERAEAAGIPVVSLDRRAAAPNISSEVLGNFYANGLQQGLYLNEVANGEGIFVKSNIFLKNLNSIDI